MRRTPRYRSVEYQPTQHPVRRLDQTADPGHKQTDSYVPLYGDDDEERPRYEGPVLKKRTTRTQDLPRGRIAEVKSPKRRGWGWVVAGAVFFLSFYLFLTGIVFPWVRGIEDRWNYGQSGVYRMFAYLGQGDSQTDPSELLAYRSHNLVIVDVVEDDRVRSFPLTFATTGLTSDIVTLEVRDMNGDGKPDILVHVGGLTVVMWSNGSGYQGTKP